MRGEGFKFSTKRIPCTLDLKHFGLKKPLEKERNNLLKICSFFVHVHNIIQQLIEVHHYSGEHL